MIFFCAAAGMLAKTQTNEAPITSATTGTARHWPDDERPCTCETPGSAPISRQVCTQQPSGVKGRVRSLVLVRSPPPRLLTATAFSTGCETPRHREFAAALKQPSPSKFAEPLCFGNDALLVHGENCT